MDELQQLLAAMGCSTASEALAQVARTNTALANIQAATGQAVLTEALAQAQGSVAFTRSVESALGATGPAALAALEGLRTSAARVPELEAELSTMRAASARRDADSAIDAASADGRLAPAMRGKADEMFAKFGLDGLNAFLAALPKAGPTSTNHAPRQPAVAPSNGAQGAATSTEEAQLRARMKAKGFSDEEIEAAAKLKPARDNGED